MRRRCSKVDRFGSSTVARYRSTSCLDMRTILRLRPSLAGWVRSRVEEPAQQRLGTVKSLRAPIRGTTETSVKGKDQAGRSRATV